MDHADDEDHEQPEEAVVDDVATDVEGFSGGPHDTSILMDYVHHVTMIIWNEDVFIFLNK